ncbi:sodium:proton antiporter [Dysgonomonas sp. BGC7]|uniref:cation:proton antiporter n=1 Tax=Dysgonomonas sp. BGC7 TaxID=1658008 RepID=UPI0006827576|nr:sodium:proton antiporter [Dysgonomonas sp. BGC7]MBD8388308.1 sodium:proton antiporter [Dysgonomonas sp. BGC7]
MDFYYSLSVLIIIATVFSYINVRFLKLPSTIGVMVIAILVSLGVVIVSRLTTTRPLHDLSVLISHIDFTQMLMGGMLNFLLFAGAININLKDLKEEKLPVIVFSSLSVIISTFVIGFALYYILGLLLPLIHIHHKMPLIYCLLFGALISPTDAVAALGILKEIKVSKPLETKVAGESLFNDGVAVVTFSIIYNIAMGQETMADLTFFSVSWLLVKETAGGIIVGLLLGQLGSYAMRTAKNYKLSVLITLSIVMGGYIVSQAMGISGPLTMVSAGLIIGDSRRKILSKTPGERGYLGIFWELIDEILNAVLFLFIGFELLLIPDIGHYWVLGVTCIVVVLFARYISIRIPTMLIPFNEKFTKGTITILVWGGLRGGVSIALALSIANGPYKEAIIAATYFVVIFSIIVQGLSISKLAHRINV